MSRQQRAVECWRRPQTALAARLRRRETGSIFKGKDIEKGVAFPTCVSINRSVGSLHEICACGGRWGAARHPPLLLCHACSVVGHFSPMPEDTTVMKDGDVVKM